MAEWTAYIEELARKTASCATLYHWLQALHGVGVIVAATNVAQVGDLRRFITASQLMSFLGLVPSERSSGAAVRRGSITKDGNPHVRWKLIEAAWHARLRPAMTIRLKRRSEGVPTEICDLAWKAQKRLRPRYWSLVSRGKRSQTAVVAVTRELCGFVWAIGQHAPARAS